MKPLLLTLLLILLVNKYQMRNLCSYKQTITNTRIWTHSINSMTVFAVVVTVTLVLSITGAQGGASVWLTAMMSELWAQPANDGLLQHRTENYRPLPPLHVSSLSPSLRISPLPFIPSLLPQLPHSHPFFYPSFSLSHPPLVLPHRQHASA